MDFNLLDVVIQSPSEDIRRAWQEEAVIRVLKWSSDHDHRAPMARDFGSGLDQINIHPNVLMGTGMYGYGKIMHESRIFSSPSEAWFAVKREANERGQHFNLYDVRINNGHMTSEFKEELKKDVMNMCVEWICQHGRMPTTKEIRSEIKVSSDKLFGEGNYRVGGQQEAHRLFSSGFEAKSAIRAECARRGIKISD